MKCRNWRTEDPERPENPEEPEEPEEPENPEDPESPEASGKRPSGRLRKIRNLPKSQAQAAPQAKICFLPQNHRLCADLFALPPRIYARNAARPCAADRKTHPPRTVNPYPCVSLRNRPKAAPEPPEHPEPPEKPEAPETPPPPSARITPIICNLTYYNLRHNTHILIINNKLFTLFLARFKIKPYLCIV